MVAVRQAGQPVVSGQVLNALLGLLALQELSDLAADHADRLQQPLIGLADFGAVEREHADRFSFGDDRKDERAVHPDLTRDSFLYADVLVDVQIAHNSCSRLPHLADQAEPGVPEVSASSCLMEQCSPSASHVREHVA